jgi:acetate kinase
MVNAPMHILVLNAGSSSLKFGLYQMQNSRCAGGQRELRLAQGLVDRIGSPQSVLRLSWPEPAVDMPISAETIEQAVGEILRSLVQAASRDSKPAISIDAVGCRVVHGGAEFTTPTRVTPAVLEAIRALSRLAPLHNPVDAEVIAAASHALPQAPVVAVFDTAFHHGLPETASTYGLPWALCQEHGLRRYGFHGISHRYVSGRLLACLARKPDGTRLIICHLGNGASLCAVRDGRSVDTSMGLTPLEGLVMGTRSGDIDPGLLLYLLRSARMTAQEVDDTLNHRSGLMGISGRSSDVRDLEKAAHGGDERALLALEVFAYRVCKYIGAYAAALEGVDAVAFTAGIGEHSAEMRSRICRRLAFLGIQLHDDRNQRATGDEPARISAEGAPLQVWVIPTDEERQIARETYALLRPAASAQ